MSTQSAVISACAVCGSANLDRLFEKESHPVLRCATCGLEFLRPQPSDAVLASIYSAQYFLGDGSPESRQRVSAMKAATAARYLHIIASHLTGSGKRLLEVGCGTGDLLVEARRRGYDVAGVEFSQSAVDAANRRLGEPLVLQGTIDTSVLPEPGFDAVIACDVMEHTREPAAFLSRVSACLKPGGTVLLIVPSCDSWTRKLFGRHWMEYKLEHLFYFGQQSLTLLLAQCGFENVRLSPNRKVLSLAYLHDHFQRFPVPICTPALNAVARLLPERLLHRHFTVPASGLLAIASKPAKP